MELDIIRFIQSFSNPFLDGLFQLFTILGEGIMIILLLTSIYWAIDKKFGEYVAFSFFTSMLLNNFIKDIFKADRPIGKEGIRSLRVETATGYSFPSGHSQSAATFYTSVAVYSKKNILWVLTPIVIFLVGISRLYLGVHYPKDVLAGILLGVITSFICHKLFNIVKNRLVMYTAVFILFLPVLLMNNSPDFVKAIGGYFGFLIGIAFEKRFVNFKVEGTLPRKIMRIILGIIIIAVLYISLKMIIPENNISYFIRYSVIAFVGIGIYPYIFKKFKI